MNIIKKFRIVAVLLVIMLSCSCFAPVTFGAEALSKAELTQESMDYLLGIGAITKSYTGKDFITTMTRKDMAAILANLIRVNHVMPTPSADPAEDVKLKNAELAHNVFIMTAYDVMPKDENGKFRPDAYATYSDVKYAFASLLGYINYAKATGLGEAELNKLIARTDLFENVNYGEDEYLTVADFLIVLKNAVDEEMIYQTLFSGTKVEFDKNTDVTMMEEYLNITQYEGMVTANKHTSIFEPSGLDTNQVLIEGYLVYTGDTNVADYIGTTVNVYVKEDPKTEKGTVIMVDYAEDTKVLTISAEDLMADSSSFSLTNITYADEKGKLKSAKASATANYFYNGRMCDIKEEDFEINNGTVTLISNDGGSTYDVVKIDTYENYIVDYVVEDGDNVLVYAKPEKIDEKTGNYITKMLDLSETGEDGIRYIDIRRPNGRVVKASQLKNGNILSAYVSKDGGYIKAVLSTTIVEGEVTGIDESDVRTVFSINGADYSAYFFGTDWSYAGDIYADMYPRMGSEGEFYIDASGYIAFIEPKVVTTRYGFVTGVVQENSMSQEVKIQLLDEDGYVVELDIPEKGIKINNYDGTVSYTKPSDVYELLSDNDQLVQYSVNSDGRLKKLNVAQDVAGSPGAVLDSYNDRAFTYDNYIGSATWSGTYYNFDSKPLRAPTSTTKIFMLEAGSVESTSKGIDVKVDGVYTTTLGKIKDGTSLSDIRYYDLDDALTAAVMVATVPEFDSTKANADQRMYVFDEISRKLDEEGNEVANVSLWYNGAKKSYVLDENAAVDKFSKGDVAAVYFNLDNEITKISNITKEIEDGNLTGKATYNRGGSEEYAYGYIGKAYVVSYNNERMVYVQSIDDAVTKETLKSIYLRSPIVYEVSEGDRDVEIKTSSLANMPKTQEPDENSLIYFFSNQGRVFDIIIYR